MAGNESGADMLAENRGRHCGSVAYSPSLRWVCWIYDENSKPHAGVSETPDAAIRTAVEKARRG